MIEDRDPRSDALIRDRFLTLVSHELRSPLNGIQSWAHVLEHRMAESGLDDPVASRALRGIRDGVSQQVQIIDDLLDTSLAMRGALDLVETRLVVADCLARSSARLRPAALERDVRIEVDAAAEDIVLGDERRLARALDHLLSNAIKFTPVGTRVHVTTAREEGTVVIRYRDEGPGVPTEVRRELFEPFALRDPSRAGSLGIGLTLARLVVERHGGRIGLDDRADEPGGSVSIALPLQPAERSAGVASAGEGRRRDVRAPIDAVDIVVVDDQRDAREALRTLLVQMGAHVEVWDSVESAIAAIRAKARLPDAVLCDIAMPEEDGYTFLQRFRQIDANASRVPVIALSSHVHVALERPDAERFDEYLAKPVSPDDLVDGIKRALARVR